jgi:hypothetical protein
MSQTISIEQRVEALEHEVTELRRQLAQQPSPDDRFRRLSGSLADQPEFDEVLRLGHQIRQTDRPNPSA